MKKNAALLEWMKAATDEQITETGTTRGYLRQIAYGNRTASAEVASRVEKVTERLITRQQLRPNDWAIIWPEIAA